MKKSAIITLILSASLLSACSKTSAKSNAKQVLNWFSAGEISTMDPALNNDVYGGEQLDATMEGLVRLGNNSKVLPGIAKSWKESKDGLTWTFKLRKNAKWANGEALTAKDFVYAWRRQVNPKTASTQSNKYSGIKNADAIVASKKPVSSLGIKAVGKYQLVVTLERKIPYFQLLLAGSAFAPQNQKFIEKAGKKYGTSAKYTLADGPYVMKGWTGSNLTWKLVKNQNYWDKKNVKLTQINFSVQKSQSTSYNLYQAGKLDMTTLSASQSKSLKNQKGWQIKKSNRTQYLMYNFKTDKNLRNVNLRRAIAAAINKESLAKTLNLADIAATSLTPSGITDPVTGKEFSQEVVTKETQAIQSGTKAQAKAYYKEALKELGKKQITIKLLGDDTDDAKKTTEFIQSALESTLGMKVEVTNMPFKNR
ncbi:MAG: peptide ABC transporter substrate-binding protein, partial [Lactobacillus porci]|nr:peptide ABC transporter substrate-binding protein [Lactobacillus porci]